MSGMRRFRASVIPSTTDIPKNRHAGKEKRRTWPLIYPLVSERETVYPQQRNKIII
jgi:hypothetical protein